MECIPNLRFSIVAPNLNEEKHLPMFLESLVQQTLQSFEVIIIDGYSTDRSIQILRDYHTKLRIKLWQDNTRNFGYLRNMGAFLSEGDIIFECNTDNYLPKTLLDDLHLHYYLNPKVISISGRTQPLGTDLIAHLGYRGFDLLRYLFTMLPPPVRAYRPSGSFTSFRRPVWNHVGGYPEVSANEDGLFGEKLDRYAYQHQKQVVFRRDLYVGHHIKRFKAMGSLRTILFYSYVFGNFLPFLCAFLRPIEQRAAAIFSGQHKPKSFKQLLRDFWEWL